MTCRFAGVATTIAPVGHHSERQNCQSNSLSRLCSRRCVSQDLNLMSRRTTHPTLSTREGSDNNSNNRAPPPDGPLNNALVHTHARDAQYYYNDGNIVFVVGDTLFKVSEFGLTQLPNTPLLNTFCSFIDQLLYLV